MSFLAPIHHDFTVDIGEQTYGIIEWGTEPEFLRPGAADIHRTFLEVGPLGSVELPVGAVAAAFMAVAIPTILIPAAFAQRRRRRRA
jgi:hypothetical protein